MEIKNGLMKTSFQNHDIKMIKSKGERGEREREREISKIVNADILLITVTKTNLGTPASNFFLHET